MQLVPQGGSCAGENIPAAPRRSSRGGISPDTPGSEPRRREHSDRSGEDKTERDLHRKSAPAPCPPSLRGSSVGAGGGCVLKLRLQKSGSGRGPGLAAQRHPDNRGCTRKKLCPTREGAATVGGPTRREEGTP